MMLEEFKSQLQTLLDEGKQKAQAIQNSYSAKFADLRRQIAECDERINEAKKWLEKNKATSEDILEILKKEALINNLPSKKAKIAGEIQALEKEVAQKILAHWVEVNSQAVGLRNQAQAVWRDYQDLFKEVSYLQQSIEQCRNSAQFTSSNYNLPPTEKKLA